MHLNMTLEYGRAVKGQRVNLPKPFVRGSKFSLIGAISTKSVEAALYGEWSTNGNIFEHFLEHSLAPKLTPENIVLMDNVGFHKSERAIAIIESTGARVDYLPPYSPELNPIELAWSFTKGVIKRLEPRSIKQFSKSLKNALEQINAEKLIGWFAHAGYRSTQ